MPPKPAAKPASPASKPPAKTTAKPTAAPVKKPAAPASNKPVTNTANAAKTNVAKPVTKPAAAPVTKSTPANRNTAQKERKEHPGVYIKGIPATERLEDIKKVFKAAGNIIAARRRGGKFCILWFDTPTAVRKAIDMFHTKTIHSHKVTVHQAKASLPVNPADVCKTIYVGGLPRDVKTRKQISAAFAGCGDIIKVRIYRDGRAFVFFKDTKSANKARNDFNGKKIFGAKITVAFSYRTKERDNLRHRRGLNRSKIYKALRELRGRKIH